MIILIDNKNYMIRYCKDEPHIHGFDTSYPNWKGEACLRSDKGETVVLSGPVAEKWLDDSHIYYVHVEHKPKENFQNFVKRLNRMVEANREYLDVNLTVGKLMFGVTQNLTKKATVDSHNYFEVWRLNKDGKYSAEISYNYIKHMPMCEKFEAVSKMIALIEKELNESCELEFALKALFTLFKNNKPVEVDEDGVVTVITNTYKEALYEVVNAITEAVAE